MALRRRNSSFLWGVATLGNLGGRRIFRDLPELDSAKALGSDWRKVGNDIREAMKQSAKHER